MSIAPQAKPINMFARNIIMGFGFKKVRFYASGVDGTDCVEYLDGDHLFKNSETVVLARRIHKFKKQMAAMDKRISEK